MQKQAVVDGIALAYPQDVVLGKTTVLPEDVNGQPKKSLTLEDGDTYRFQAVYEQNKLLLSQRLKSNQLSAEQFKKTVAVAVPNLVLNNFQQLKHDSLPLIVAMIAQVYNQLENYTDNLAKALKEHSPTSDVVKELTESNPVEKNYFFLPYDLVRTLLNFDSIDKDFEVNKFVRSIREILEFSFPIYFNRAESNPKDAQYNLLTSFVGNDLNLHKEAANVQAFENCFYWVEDKSEYMCFTIAPEFRNLLRMILNEVKDGNTLRQVLPYTRIDWHFLHFLPQRNNIRQMYLFIKSNIYNHANRLVKSASIEYKLSDLKRFMGVDKESHYAENDSHFVRDKIRNVVEELSDTPGCEYTITISKRTIKTPGGLKDQIITFNVKMKRSFEDSLKAILKHIKVISNEETFKNDWLIVSCLRYCTEEQLSARIDQAWGKFIGMQKKAGKKYEGLPSNSHFSRFLYNDLHRYWGKLAESMFIENPRSSYSRLVKKIVDTESSANKIYSSPATQIVQTKKRGRPPKNPVENPLPKNLSKDERKFIEKFEAEKRKAKEAKAKADTDLVEENTQVVQAETQEKPVQQDLLADQENNVIVFPKEQVLSDADRMADEIAQAKTQNEDDLETDFQSVPSNFTAPPPVEVAPWDAYSENEVSMELSPDAYDLDGMDTFIINTDNLVEHLQPVNGNTDHYVWVNDYLEHMNDDHQSDANSLFYDLFNLTAILNIIEHDNKQFQSRNVKYIDLYREKLNIVFQTLFKFYGTYEQRNDQASVYAFLVEKTAEILFESSEISPEQRMFTRGLFVQLAEAVKAEKKVSMKEFYSLRGQCVAYPFTE